MLLDARVKTFLEVAACGSFSAAGRALYMSAVSVMKHIDSLESELGVQLFVRSNKGVVLTAAGQVLREDAERLVRLAESACDRVRGEVGTPTIRVGTSPLRPCKPLVDLWTRVGANLHFDVRIVAFEDDKLSGPDPLDSRVDCFVGPCDAPSWSETCSIVEFGSYRCEIGVPVSHPLAARASLSWDDLSGERLLLVREGASPVMDAIRADVSAHPDITIVDAVSFYTLDTFNECARGGFLMETLDAWEGVHPGIVTIPMEWDHAVPYGIVYAKDHAPHVGRFIEVLAKEVRPSL